MPDDHTAVQERTALNESLGELLRARALESSPRLLIGQAAAAVAMNVAVMLWHPERWGITTTAVAAVVLHALWALAVQRTTATDEARTWWRLRRASAIGASASALLLLWFACMMLLGRMIS